MIKNTINIIENGKKRLIKYSVSQNSTYESLHSNLLKNNFKTACSFRDGKKLMTLIDKIQELNS